MKEKARRTLSEEQKAKMRAGKEAGRSSGNIPKNYLGHRLYPVSDGAYGRYCDGRCDCGSFNTTHRYRTTGDHAMYAICLDCGWEEPEKAKRPISENEKARRATARPRSQDRA